jgi:hypothetical protein
MAQKTVHMLGAQNVNGRSQSEMDGFRAEVLDVWRTVRTSSSAISNCS